MDDNAFDKIIREKAEGYRDSGQDPHALSDIRRRLAGIAPTKSGWSLGKAGAIAAAMALFTMINFGIVWYFSEGRYAKLTTEMELLKEERGQLMDLQEEFIQLKATKVDTVYVYREVLSNINTTGQVTAPLGVASPFYPGNQSAARDNNADYYQRLQQDEALSRELEAFLVRNNLLLVQDDQGRLLLVHNQAVRPIIDKGSQLSYGTSRPAMPGRLAKVMTLDQGIKPKEKEKNNTLSNKMLWALERHNNRGVDFQFGVEGMYTKPLFDIGTGEANSSFGLLTEVIFSPQLRLETGVHFGPRAYVIKEDEIMGLEPGTLDNYPGIDPDVGQLIRLESESKLIRVPVNLKLMGILDHNKRWYASAGVTPHYITTQELDYQYAIENAGPGGDGDGEFRAFIGGKQEANPGFFAGTLNLGVGTEVYINEKARWQVGVFYERGLTEYGIENRKFQGFGVKSSLWFNRP